MVGEVGARPGEDLRGRGDRAPRRAGGGGDRQAAQAAGDEGLGGRRLGAGAPAAAAEPQEETAAIATVSRETAAARRKTGRRMDRFVIARSSPSILPFRRARRRPALPYQPSR